MELNRDWLYRLVDMRPIDESQKIWISSATHKDQRSYIEDSWMAFSEALNALENDALYSRIEDELKENIYKRLTKAYEIPVNGSWLKPEFVSVEKEIEDVSLEGFEKILG